MDAFVRGSHDHQQHKKETLSYQINTSNRRKNWTAYISNVISVQKTKMLQPPAH